MHLDWDDIPSEPYYSTPTRRRIREIMQHKNPWRWRRLTRDFAWLQSEMKKAGLNPEDGRFLL